MLTLSLSQDLLLDSNMATPVATVGQSWPPKIFRSAVGTRLSERGSAGAMDRITVPQYSFLSVCL